MKKFLILISFLVISFSSQAMWRRASFTGKKLSSGISNTMPSFVNDRSIKVASVFLTPNASRLYGKINKNESNESKYAWLDNGPVKASTHFWRDLRDSFFGTTPEREKEKQKEIFLPLYNIHDRTDKFTPGHIEEVIDNLPAHFINQKDINAFFVTYYYEDCKREDSPLEVIFKADNFYLASQDEEATDKNIEIIFKGKEKYADYKIHNAFIDKDKFGFIIEKGLAQGLVVDNQVDEYTEQKIHHNSFFERQDIHYKLVKKLINKGAIVTKETLRKLILNSPKYEVCPTMRVPLGAIKALLDSDKNAELIADENSIQDFADLIQKKLVITKKGKMLHRGSGSNDGNLHVIEIITTENYDMVRLKYILDEYFAKNKQSLEAWNEKTAVLQNKFAQIFHQFEEYEKSEKKVSYTIKYSKKSSVRWPYTKEEEAEMHKSARNYDYWR